MKGAWKIESNHIVFQTENELLHPNAEELFAVVNSLPSNFSEEYECEDIHSAFPDVRFSTIGSDIRVDLFSDDRGDIFLELYCYRRNKRVSVDIIQGVIVDQCCTNSEWFYVTGEVPQIEKLFAKCQIKEKGKISLSQYIKLLRDADSLIASTLQNNVSFDSLNKSIDMSGDLPHGLNATLYKYQKKGFFWMMYMLNESGGCILGDEMGLGKTLQVIAVILEYKHQCKTPVLVIAPVSLLQNWKRECEKFAPELRVAIHHGPSRTGRYKELQKNDVVIMSYSAVVTDNSLLTMIHWKLVVLDEAQNIKNPHSDRTIFVKKIPRETCIAVTGTPFENHVTDIWSLMDFVLPGSLGSELEYKEYISDDICGADKVEPLLSPIMLRRLYSMARKSRKSFSQANSSYNMTSLAASEIIKKPRYYKVGIYARLSFESEMNKERDTVDTQISFIKDYIARQDDMEIYDVYADISLTGTNFNRPEFNRMIEDIKSGKINTIITKDLSRLGRNYIESGTYIERIFPMFNVRYIAITDDFDSIRPDADITMPLKNIVNEYYSKDLSDKVWTAFRSIWKSGLYVCGRPPYGYKKNREKKCLEIDEYAAQVVKRIFSMYLNGMKLAEIARTLKNEGILSPSQYRYFNIGDKEKFDKAKDWYYVQVKDILKDQQYVGDSVHGKSGGKLGEHRTKRRNDKADWIIIPDTHEAIVSREEFAIVQKMISDSTKQFNDAINRGRQKSPVPKNKFVGKCTCGQCGSRVFIKRKDTGKSEFYYYCAGEKSSVLCRDRHVKIPYEDLDRSVFSVIKKHMQICIEKISLIQKLNATDSANIQYKVLNRQLDKLRNERKRIISRGKGLYEDYKDKFITAEEYVQFQKEYKKQIEDIDRQITEYENHINKYRRDFHLDESWESIIAKFQGKRILTQEIVDAFVSEIKIYPDKNIEVKLYYDDMLVQLVSIADVREAECNGR